MKHLCYMFYYPNSLEGKTGKTGPKHICGVYFRALFEVLGTRFWIWQASGDINHQKQTTTKGKTFFFHIQHGQVNDVIGRKCLKCETLCLLEILNSLWQRVRIHTAVTKERSDSAEGAQSSVLLVQIFALRSKTSLEICHALKSALLIFFNFFFFACQLNDKNKLYCSFYLSIDYSHTHTHTRLIYCKFYMQHELKKLDVISDCLCCHSV